jgi:hypothetical protein
MNFAFEITSFVIQSDFLHVVNSSDMGLTALLSLRRKASCGILLPLKSISSAGFKPANLGSNDKHANHYTTEATTCNRQSASKHQRDRIFISLAERASSAQFVYCRWRGWLIDWIDCMIMLIRWDVSEPRPQIGLLFIPRVTCERGEPWWWW